MFSLYGLDGRVFYGPLEDLRTVRPVDQVFRVATLDPDEPGAGQYAPSREEGDAANARRLQQGYGDLDRGPLYLAAQIMQRPVVTTSENEPVEHAWRLLRDRRIHQAPVLDAGGRLVGIVSERDLLTAINLDDGQVLTVLQRQVRDVMTSPVVAAVPDTDIRRIAQAMLMQGVDGVPIVNEVEALVGFISRSDILRAVVSDPPLSLWR